MKTYRVVESVDAIVTSAGVDGNWTPSLFWNIFSGKERREEERTFFVTIA
jgi:hypothetical protein